MKTTIRQQLLDAHELFNAYFFKDLLNTPDFIFYDKCLMDDAYNIWDIYNIPEYAEIDIDTVGHVYGYYLEPNTIGLSVGKDMINTLLHEMIHQYQYEFNLIDKDHGTTFRKYARYMETTLNLEKGDI